MGVKIGEGMLNLGDQVMVIVQIRRGRGRGTCRLSLLDKNVIGWGGEPRSLTNQGRTGQSVDLNKSSTRKSEGICFWCHQEGHHS